MSVLLEHRGWFIKTYGETGRDVVAAIERINGAIAIYGFVRMATQMPRMVSDLKKGSQRMEGSCSRKKGSPAVRGKRREISTLVCKV